MSPVLGALIQRVLFSLLFIIPGVMHAMDWNGTVNTTAAVFGAGVGATILSVIAIVLLIFGGLSILTAKMTEIGGWMLAIFLLGGAYVHYTFGGMAPNAMAEQIQMAHVMKNIALLGVALRYGFGANPKA